MCQLRSMFIVICCLIVCDAVVAGVKFSNNGKKLEYVRALYGANVDCSKKPIRENFSLNPGDVRELASVAGEKVCYITSTHPKVEQYPMHCGETDQDLDVSTLTQPCNGTFTASSVRQVSPKSSVKLSATEILLEYNLTSWNDPLTPPHTATRCVSEAWGHWPWCDEWRTCNGWATDCSWLRNELFLIVRVGYDPVTIPDPAAVVSACLNEAATAAALAGAVAAIVTGAGAAAAEQAFIAVFQACLVAQLNPIEIRFEQRNHWTPWGPC
jgi:hypothetical protein